MTVFLMRALPSHLRLNFYSVTGLTALTYRSESPLVVVNFDLDAVLELLILGSQLSYHAEVPVEDSTEIHVIACLHLLEDFFSIEPEISRPLLRLTE